MMTDAQAKAMTMDQVRAWILHHEQMGAKFSQMLQQMTSEQPPTFGSCSGGSCRVPSPAQNPNFGRGGGGARGGGGFHGGGGRPGGGGFRHPGGGTRIIRGGGWGGWWPGYYPYYPYYPYYSSPCGRVTAATLVQMAMSSGLSVTYIAATLGVPALCPEVLQAAQLMPVV